MSVALLLQLMTIWFGSELSCFLTRESEQSHFWARGQNVLHRFQFKSDKKKHLLSKGQKHLEIILQCSTAHKTQGSQSVEGHYFKTITN